MLTILWLAITIGYTQEFLKRPSISLAAFCCKEDCYHVQSPHLRGKLLRPFKDFPGDEYFYDEVFFVREAMK